MRGFVLTSGVAACLLTQAACIEEMPFTATDTATDNVDVDAPDLASPDSYPFDVTAAVDTTVAPPSDVATVADAIVPPTDVAETTHSDTDDTGEAPLIDEETIRVEVTWETPGDPYPETPGRTTGPDVDLHLLHPRANGAWFDPFYDCFWLNPGPNWGGSGAFDDPRIERDDTNGLGPEIIVMSMAEFGAVYRVGVHYFNDHDFGPSRVTVRIYIYEQLRFTWEDVVLNKDDMWEVATIGWPSQAVTALRTTYDEPVITPGVRMPE